MVPLGQVLCRGGCFLGSKALCIYLVSPEPGTKIGGGGGARASLAGWGLNFSGSSALRQQGGELELGGRVGYLSRQAQRGWRPR